MSNYKDQTTSQSTTKAQQNTTRYLGNHHNGFYHRSASIKRYNLIFTVVDHHSKAVILSPCYKTITTKQTSQLLIDNMWK